MVAFRNYRKTLTNKRRVSASAPVATQRKIRHFFVLVAGASFVMVSSCASPKRVATFVYADASPSFNEIRRKEGTTELKTLANHQLPPKTPMKIWTFSQAEMTEPRFSGTVSSAADLRLFNEWYEAGGSVGDGTYCVPALEQSIKDARRAQENGERIAVVFITDGGFSDLEKAHKLAAQLAGFSSVAAVWIAPVELDPNTQARLEKAFAPLAETNRLIVSNRLDMAQGYKEFKKALRRP